MKRRLVTFLLSAVMILLGLATISFAKGVYYDTLQAHEKATGNKIESFQESPMLRVKVAAGDLPPVEERLPEEPLVCDPFEEIGEYGGTLHGFAMRASYWQDLEWIRRKDGLFMDSLDGTTIRPGLAKGYELSEDLTTFTIYLRRGLKWSDGVPFTTDDILFYFEDQLGNEELFPAYPANLITGGERVRITKIDDYAIEFAFTEPNVRNFVYWIARDGGQNFQFDPKHYLQKWHIKYNTDADKVAKSEGYDHWYECFNFHAGLYGLNPDINLPRIGPVVLKQLGTSQIISERNPYYWIVDTAGNQLPYIDYIVSDIVSADVYQMKLISGETDLAWLNPSLVNYPLYKENEEQGNYRVVLWPGKRNSELTMWINLNDSNLTLRKIKQDVRFRQALSLAINREEISEVIFFGKAVPCQAAPVPSSAGYREEWPKTFAQYDPQEANRLLDEMGLTARDKEGFRVDPDGETILMLIEYVEMQGPKGAILELIKEYWERVGIKVFLKPEGGDLFGSRMASIDHGVKVWHGSLLTGGVPPDANQAWLWDQWIQSNGERGEEPPLEVKRAYELLDALNRTMLGSGEANIIGRELGDLMMENLWAIGTVGYAPQPHILRSNLRNYPIPIEQISPFNKDWHPLTVLEQLFFKSE